MGRQVRFDRLRFDPETGRLWAGAQEVRLTPKSAAVLALLVGEFAEAERHFQRALVLDPNHSTARQGLSLYLAAMGRLDEALDELRKAREIDPVSNVVEIDAGNLLYYARRYEAAEAACQKVLEREAQFAPRPLQPVQIRAAQGRHEAAVAAWKAAMALVHGDDITPFLNALQEAHRTRGWTGYLRENIQLVLREVGLEPATTR